MLAQNDKTILVACFVKLFLQLHNLSNVWKNVSKMYWFKIFFAAEKWKCSEYKGQNPLFDLFNLVVRSKSNTNVLNLLSGDWIWEIQV